MENSEADDKVECRLQLCQSEAGSRFFAPLEEIHYIEGKFHPDAYFITLPIPCYLIKKRLFSTISQRYRLDDNLRFFVDAHNLWLTENEIKQMGDFDEGKISKIDWSTPASPSFAPK